jgi:hypothetical protein
MNVKLIVAWLFVGLCLGWGLVKSIQQAGPLFTGVKEEIKKNPKTK